MQHEHDEPAVQPLTRRNADGDVYTRTPEVERQIAGALRLPPGQVIAYAQIEDAAAASAPNK